MAHQPRPSAQRSMSSGFPAKVCDVVLPMGIFTSLCPSLFVAHHVLSRTLFPWRFQLLPLLFPRVFQLIPWQPSGSEQIIVHQDGQCILCPPWLLGCLSLQLFTFRYHAPYTHTHTHTHTLILGKEYIGKGPSSLSSLSSSHLLNSVLQMIQTGEMPSFNLSGV